MTDAARRYAAELRLSTRLQGLVAHELGNPLQSLVVLVELTRDELAARDPQDRGVARLDRALESVDRFRDVLIAAGRVRQLVFNPGPDARAWAGVLDELITAVAHRLVRVEFHRATEAIDALPHSPGLPPAAVLAALVGVGEQLRRLAPEGVRVELRGDVDDGRVELKLILTTGDRAVELEAGLGDWLADLLAESPGARVELCAGTLTLSAPLA